LLPLLASAAEVEVDGAATQVSGVTGFENASASDIVVPTLIVINVVTVYWQYRPDR
jgi:hypothetical protein